MTGKIVKKKKERKKEKKRKERQKTEERKERKERKENAPLLYLIMMYRPIKFDCKKISTSVAMADLENSKPILLHGTPAHDDASQHKVW